LTPKQREVVQKVRNLCRVEFKAWKTEQSYVGWVCRYLLWWAGLSPEAKAGFPEPAARFKGFLEYLATVRKVSPATQSQAFNAILYLFKVMGVKLGEVGPIKRPPERKRKPIIVDRQIVERVIAQMPNSPESPTRLIAEICYRSGTRISEALSLRVKDVQFSDGLLILRDCKGFKDRDAILPCALVVSLKAQLAYARRIWEEDQHRKNCHSIPLSLLRKYPHLERSWNWAYVFPGHQLSIQRETGRRLRHHLLDSVVQRAMAKIVRQDERADGVLTPHILRHCFVDNLLKNGMRIEEVREVVGHEDIRTTAIYAHPEVERARQIVDEVAIPPYRQPARKYVLRETAIDSETRAG